MTHGTKHMTGHLNMALNFETYDSHVTHGTKHMTGHLNMALNFETYD